MEFDWFIKKINLLLTDTLNSCNVKNEAIDFEKMKVNYDNCINIYDLINEFNQLYLLFKNEYDNLEKLDLGKSITKINFVKNNDNSRYLEIAIDEPKVINAWNTILNINEKNGEINLYAFNDIGMLKEYYYRKNVDLDKSKLKKYLDLFEKHSLFLSLYNFFHRQFVFGDNHCIMLSKITNKGNDFLDILDKYIISIYDGDYNSINLCVNLGNEFDINPNLCFVELYNRHIYGNRDIYANVLKNIYINKKYLNNLYSNEENKDKILKKSN